MQGCNAGGRTLFVLGHLGITLAGAEAVAGRKSRLALRDLAWLSLGALLPDVVDKMLALLVLSPRVTRSIGHSLAFVVCLLLLWLLFQRRWQALLCAAAAGHLLLDQMWTRPEILLWPLTGWSFPRFPHDDYLTYLARPSVWGSEILGIILLGMTYRHRRLRNGIGCPLEDSTGKRPARAD